MTTQEKISYLLNTETDAKERVNLLDQLTISIKENRPDVHNNLKQEQGGQSDLERAQIEPLFLVLFAPHT